MKHYFITPLIFFAITITNAQDYTYTNYSGTTSQMVGGTKLFDLDSILDTVVELSMPYQLFDQLSNQMYFFYDTIFDGNATGPGNDSEMSTAGYFLSNGRKYHLPYIPIEESFDSVFYKVEQNIVKFEYHFDNEIIYQNWMYPGGTVETRFVKFNYDNSGIFFMQTTPTNFYQFHYVNTGSPILEFMQSGLLGNPVSGFNFATNFPDLSVVHVFNPINPAGISEFNTVEIDVFPNPTNELIHINSPQLIEQVHVIAQRGRSVDLIPFDGNELSMNISTYGKGVYFVKIITNKGTSVEKVIVQ